MQEAHHHAQRHALAPGNPIGVAGLAGFTAAAQEASPAAGSAGPPEDCVVVADNNPRYIAIADDGTV